MGRLTFRICLAAQVREREFSSAALVTPVNSSCKLECVVSERSSVLSQPYRIHSNRTAYQADLARLRFFQFVVFVKATSKYSNSTECGTGTKCGRSIGVKSVFPLILRVYWENEDPEKSDCRLSCTGILHSQSGLRVRSGVLLASNGGVDCPVRNRCSSGFQAPP